MTPSYFQYWGKAEKNQDGELSYHPLAYHCLDVVAVATVWMKHSPSLRRNLAHSLAGQTDESHAYKVIAWTRFFICLHDFGKWDVQFQVKALDMFRTLRPEIDLDDLCWSPHYDHGSEGYHWLIHDFAQLTGISETDEATMDAWHQWMQAVAGHHGTIPQRDGVGNVPSLDGEEKLLAIVVEQDQHARKQWLDTAEALFLKAAGISLKSSPPRCSVAAQYFIAGLCSVCDWIGSNTHYFKYRRPDLSPEDYFNQRVKEISDKNILEQVGILSTINEFHGVQPLLPENGHPRGIQHLLQHLTPNPGLTLAEAPTGSGKTEFALAHAWRLLAAGRADSIIFALPTQATANAMLARIEQFADHAFTAGANIILAHGKRDYHRGFKRLVETGHARSFQGDEEAGNQCAQWLAQSRKRVFLGQIGVCTIDQVLLSVLPLRHKFIRGFGIGRSVLIVDEVHAYDAYMHGLLCEILRRQQACGGSAVLLSATLPSELRQRLLSAWDAESKVTVPPDYPLVTHIGDTEPGYFPLAEQYRPAAREVQFKIVATDAAEPPDDILQQIAIAAQKGARVVLIVNLVDVAQRSARRLRELCETPVDLFHARFRFIDRQRHEQSVLDHYGPTADRSGGGRVLVATQVVEQSLDLDFDWMVTQICPVDLLFQRLGRLHRHHLPRPPGFDQARCTVITVPTHDFGVHAFIYEDPRLLWRTARFLATCASRTIHFPDAYRDWIERCYAPGAWEDEPDEIFQEHLAFKATDKARQMDAQRYIDMSIRQFRETENSTNSLTRDGEMGLGVLPVLASDRLLEGQPIKGTEDPDYREDMDLHTIPVPRSNNWKADLGGLEHDDEGRCRLIMTQAAETSWVAELPNSVLTYSTDTGLERTAKADGPSGAPRDAGKEPKPR